MSDHKENARRVHEAVRPVLNGLSIQQGIPVRDVNAALLGMVTRSMEADIGAEQARDFIESAMNNVWGKRPPNKLREKMKGFLFNQSKDEHTTKEKVK